MPSTTSATRATPGDAAAVAGAAPPLSSFADCAVSSSDEEQIELDLHRACREALGIGDADAAAHRAALRRLLRGWCAHCPALGYVQGQAVIAAAALVACDHAEEAAWQMFSGLLRSLRADFYAAADATGAPAMRGCLVEVGALQLLARARWGGLFDDDGAAEMLGLMATQWFATLFASELPLEATLVCWRRLLRAPRREVAEWTDAALEVAPTERCVSGSAADGALAQDDALLRVGLALLQHSVPALQEARAADAAMNAELGDDAGGGGGETYEALRRVTADWPTGADGGAGALLAACDSLSLPALEVERARVRAAVELEQQTEARAAEKRARREAAARRGAEEVPPHYAAAFAAAGCACLLLSGLLAVHTARAPAPSPSERPGESSGFGTRYLEDAAASVLAVLGLGLVRFAKALGPCDLVPFCCGLVPFCCDLVRRWASRRRGARTWTRHLDGQADGPADSMEAARGADVAMVARTTSATRVQT